MGGFAKTELPRISVRILSANSSNELNKTTVEIPALNLWQPLSVFNQNKAGTLIAIIQLATFGASVMLLLPFLIRFKLTRMHKSFFYDEIQYCFEGNSFNRHLYGIQRMQPKRHDTSKDEEGPLLSEVPPDGPEDDALGRVQELSRDDATDPSARRRARPIVEDEDPNDGKSAGASDTSRSAKHRKNILEEGPTPADAHPEDTDDERAAAQRANALGAVAADDDGAGAFTQSEGAAKMQKIVEELEDDAASKVSYFVEDEVTGKIRKLKISKNSSTFQQMQQIIDESKRLLRGQYERQNNDLGLLQLQGEAGGRGLGLGGLGGTRSGLLALGEYQGAAPETLRGNAESRQIETNRNKSLEISDLSLEQQKLGSGPNAKN